MVVILSHLQIKRQWNKGTQKAKKCEEESLYNHEDNFSLLLFPILFFCWFSAPNINKNTSYNQLNYSVEGSFWYFSTDKKPSLYGGKLQAASWASWQISHGWDGVLQSQPIAALLFKLQRKSSCSTTTTTTTHSKLVLKTVSSWELSKVVYSSKVMSAGDASKL